MSTLEKLSREELKRWQSAAHAIQGVAREYGALTPEQREGWLGVGLLARYMEIVRAHGFELPRFARISEEFFASLAPKPS